jgi:nucleotide-binding universal stress UspA family protein
MVFDRASGSRPALDRAADLALRNDARLTVVVCLADFDREGDGGGLQEILRRGLREHFEQLVEPFRTRGQAVSVEMLVGRPFVQVIRRVIGHDHDLVVKTAEAIGHRGFTFGSFDLHLLRKCPEPVWILRERSGASGGAVLAAIAPSGENTGVDRLNVRILELASSLAVQRGRPLHVVQAWTPPDPVLLRCLGWPDPEDPVLGDRLGRQRRRAEARFEALVDPFVRPGRELNPHFVDGAAADAIVGMVREHAVDVVVMSTLTRSGVPGLLIGRTAEDVLRQIDCSVLAVKPDGFLSPVAA